MNLLVYWSVNLLGCMHMYVNARNKSDKLLIHGTNTDHLI